jgi:hypothetical protein
MSSSPSAVYERVTVGQAVEERLRSRRAAGSAFSWMTRLAEV